MNKDKFWGFCENDNFKVGCTGGSIYVLDENGFELKRFKNLRYAYQAKFVPGTNNIVVKTTEGQLLFYNLDNLELIKKVTISKEGCQDGGFKFSPDGKWLYNIESPGRSKFVQLTKYSTVDFSVNKIINKDNEHITLDSIEFSKKTNKYYLLGCTRDEEFCYDYGFVAELVDDKIIILKKVDPETHFFVSLYKDWADSGFTKKSFESLFMGKKDVKPVTLAAIAEEGWELH